MNILKFYKKDEKVLASRRRFLRTLGLSVGAFSIGAGAQFDFMKRAAKKLGYSELFAAEGLSGRPSYTFSFHIRAGFNFRKLIANASAADIVNRRDIAHHWAGNKEPGTSSDIANQGIAQAENGLWLPSGGAAGSLFFDRLGSHPIAICKYDATGHSPRFNITQGSLNNGGNNLPSDQNKPSPDILAASTGSRLAVFPNIVHWRQTNNVTHNVGNAALQANGFNPRPFQVVNNAAQFLDLFSGGIPISGLTDEEKLTLASTIDEMTAYRFQDLSVTNENQILGVTGSAADLLGLDLEDALSLSESDMDSFDVRDSLDVTGVQADRQNYNLGEKLAYFYKAASLGLAQNFVCDFNEDDQHSETEIDLRDNVGWQRLHAAQSYNFARAFGEFLDRLKNTPSLFSPGLTMLEDSVIGFYSEFGRQMNAPLGSNTDGGDGSFIIAGKNIKSGVFYDEDYETNSTYYPSNPSSGGQLTPNDQARMTGPQGWRALARAYAGDEVASKFHEDIHLKDGQLISYFFKP